MYNMSILYHVYYIAHLTDMTRIYLKSEYIIKYQYYEYKDPNAHNIIFTIKCTT